MAPKKCDATSAPVRVIDNFKVSPRRWFTVASALQIVLERTKTDSPWSYLQGVIATSLKWDNDYRWPSIHDQEDRIDARPNCNYFLLTPRIPGQEYRLITSAPRGFYLPCKMDPVRVTKITQSNTETLNLFQLESKSRGEGDWGAYDGVP